MQLPIINNNQLIEEGANQLLLENSFENIKPEIDSFTIENSINDTETFIQQEIEFIS